MNTVLSVQVSLFHGLSLPTIPSPTTPRCPCAIVWFCGPQGLPPRLHLPMDRTYGQRRHLGFAITQQARHNDRPNRVRHYPTDWSFTSCCSPPRLATTQLQLVTTFRPNFGEDLHLADSDHLQARCATAFGSAVHVGPFQRFNFGTRRRFSRPVPDLRPKRAECQDDLLS
jgi:hypothetical protein